MNAGSFVQRSFMFLSTVGAAVVIAGCLISEYDEYRIVLNADGKSGTVTTIKRNIQSDQKDPAKQQEDFESLIQNWKGDQYLLEKTKEEIYVKERKLARERGVLVWKEVAVFADIHRLFPDAFKGDSMHIKVGSDETVTATNGALIRMKDSTLVQWPLAAKEFLLKIQKNDFKATSNFAVKFQEYVKKHRK